MSHIKLEQAVLKLYMQNICGGHLGFSVFVHYLQTICRVMQLVCVSGYI